MSKSLSLENVPDEPLATSDVFVPEFGVGDDGEPYKVNVRALTVGEFNAVVRRAYVMESVEPENEGDKPYKMGFAEDIDEQCLVVAWCSVDDEGNLVFGKTKHSAEERVRNLPRKYQPAVTRIYSEAWKLSRLGLDKDASTEAIDEIASKN